MGARHQERGQAARPLTVMALVATRVLIINRQLNFSISIKQALEQIGAFEVSPFTSADTALDYLRQHPQDVAVVDLTLLDLPGADMVLRLRTLQPEIGIIATPNRPEVAALVRELDLQGIIDVPCTARELIPLIERAVVEMRDTLPDTAQAPAVSLTEEEETLTIPPNVEPPLPETPTAEMPAPPDLPEFSTLDSVLVKLGGLEPSGHETLDITVDEYGDIHPVERIDTTPVEPVRSIEFVLPDAPQERIERTTFQQLAAEEPPLPALEDSGTVGDLMIGVDNTNFGEVMAILRGEDTPVSPAQPPPKPETMPEESISRIPALVILESALDETTPLEAFSINDLLANIDKQLPEHQRGVRPLPSWIYESERYVREPDFLPEELPPDEHTEEYTGQTTKPSSQQTVVADPQALDTDRIELTVRSKPAAAPPPPPEILPEGIPALDDTARQAPLPVIEQETAPLEEVGEHMADFERLSAATPAEELEEAAVSAPVTAPPAPSEDPYIAQLALSLTQVSLELTAEATLLARGGKIVAYAGTLPQEDIDDIHHAVANDWEANPQQARIRFVTLPSSGKDYMLYSRRADGGFTLSMIFAGAMPLRVIRRQSDRLVEALQAVPETVPEAPPAAEPAAVEAPAPAALPAVGTLTAFTYLWLLRDPNAALSPRAMQAIRQQLAAQLAQAGWSVEALEVHEDYVYLRAEVPSEPPPYDLLTDLKRRSAAIARAADPAIDPDTLWADSYLALTPGRELSIEEIQRFLDFAR